MKKKKFLSMLLALSVFVFLLTGCNSNNKTTTQNEQEGADTPETTEKVVLKFAAQNDNTPATQAAIDAFNGSQDKYEVKWVEMTNDSAQMHDQLLTSLSSGSDEYDILSMDVVWAGEFAGAGFITPIDAYMSDAGLTKEQYNSGSMASGNFKGKQYTLPFFPDLGLLYFRSDIVSNEDAAKLISGDYTYADLAAMSEKYAGQAGTKYGFLYQSKQYEGLTVNVTEYTKSFADIKGGLEQMYVFTTASYSPKDILNYMEGETHTNFEQGNAVFARNWPYQFGRIKGQEDGVTVKVDQVGIAPLPNGGSVGGWLLGINKNSKNAEGAWEFIQFLAGPEGQKIMSIQGGYLPGFNALLEDQEVIAGNDMLSYEGFKNALSNTIARPVSPEYSKVSDTIQIEAHKYLSSGEGLDAAVEAIQAAIAQ
ncbi:extracellular solute-binding protein [Schinkia azotoformans]|uniref:extracellular solute-binding protein n=1 Tax=Schinkia azotoformans TaxID=1454 RepID=UPI002DB6CF19|nr:extracellular solute-binding protein [Schinkia azotoformans]MEC1722803.1 extracellular solute-binding protein [Schinkia azotoformans]MED4351469.1 extracellular solute-binding protein [Schinkia azotoformans]MED4413123.1 extracellular solute-binding protein [Schinkia azotoformans]